MEITVRITFWRGRCLKNGPGETGSFEAFFAKVFSKMVALVLLQQVVTV